MKYDPILFPVVIIDELVLEMLMIHRARFAAQGHFGTTAKTILIEALVVVATADDKPLNLSQIARQLGMPPNTVMRHLHTLVAMGRARKIGDVYLAEPDASLDDALADLVSRAAVKLKAARELRLRVVGG